MWNSLLVVDKPFSDHQKAGGLGEWWKSPPRIKPQSCFVNPHFSPSTHISREHTRDTAPNSLLPPLAPTKAPRSVGRTDTVPLTRAESIGGYCRLYRKQPKGGPDFSVEGGKAGLKPIHRGGRLPAQRQRGPAILPD